jgi:hypothetical protein
MAIAAIGEGTSKVRSAFILFKCYLFKFYFGGVRLCKMNWAKSSSA